IIGLRLGAALAMKTASQRDDIEALVLWDPVVRGTMYLEDLKTAHENPTLDGILFPGVRRDEKKGFTEILGIRLADRMVDDLKQLDLLNMSGEGIQKKLLIVSHENETDEELQRYFDPIDFQRVASPQIWINDEQALVPAKLLQGITQWTRDHLE
ncbi:MAG: hypothetical protein AAF492_08175, partial [Verrucomicrobiota bacterium]